MDKRSREETCAVLDFCEKPLSFMADEGSKGSAELKRKTEQTLLLAIEHGYSCFLVGLYGGFSLWAAECLLTLRISFPYIKVEAVVSDEKLFEQWAEAEIRRYEHVLNQCDGQTVLSFGHAGDFARERNRYMLGQSALMIGFSENTDYDQKDAYLYAASRGVNRMMILP